MSVKLLDFKCKKAERLQGFRGFSIAKEITPLIECSERNSIVPSHYGSELPSSVPNAILHR